MVSVAETAALLTNEGVVELQCPCCQAKLLVIVLSRDQPIHAARRQLMMLGDRHLLDHTARRAGSGGAAWVRSGDFSETLIVTVLDNV